MRAGIEAFEGLEYERAIALLEGALAESVTREERITALRTIAFACFALGHEADARTAFERLLRIDPSHQLDRRHAPRLRVLLEETRKKLATQPVPAQPPEAPTHNLPTIKLGIAPGALHEGAPATLTFADANRDAPTLAVYYRTGVDRRTFALLEGHRTPDGTYQVEIPGAEVRPPRLEYYALLLDGGGTPLARAGALGEPLHEAVLAKRRPIYKRAWFWGTLGGVAAAGVLAAVLAVTLTPTPSASVTLSPH